MTEPKGEAPGSTPLPPAGFSRRTSDVGRYPPTVIAGASRQSRARVRSLLLWMPGTGSGMTEERLGTNGKRPGRARAFRT
jgi:hypothetical protein